MKQIFKSFFTTRMDGAVRFALAHIAGVMQPILKGLTKGREQNKVINASKILLTKLAKNQNALILVKQNVFTLAYITVYRPYNKDEP